MDDIELPSPFPNHILEIEEEDKEKGKDEEYKMKRKGNKVVRIVFVKDLGTSSQGKIVVDFPKSKRKKVKKEAPIKKWVEKKKKIVEKIWVMVEESESEDEEALNNMIKKVSLDRNELKFEVSEKIKLKKVVAKKIVEKVVEEVNGEVF